MQKLRLSKSSMSVFFLVTILSVSNSLCAAIVLDFEGTEDQKPINDFYNGGHNSSGGSGRNYGVRFSGDAIGLIDQDLNFDLFSGNFANEPSANTVTLFREGGDATLNVRSGFDTGFSFYYSYKSHEKAFVNIYDGENGTGSLLGSLKLSTNFNDGCRGDPRGDYCNWDSAGMNFKGKAKSVVFGGPAEFALYDNITLGSATPSKVPVPAGFWLMGSGLLGLSRVRRSNYQLSLSSNI